MNLVIFRGSGYQGPPKSSAIGGGGEGGYLFEKIPSGELVRGRLSASKQVHAFLVFKYNHKDTKDTLSAAAKSTSIKLLEIQSKHYCNDRGEYPSWYSTFTKGNAKTLAKR